MHQKIKAPIALTIISCLITRALSIFKTTDDNVVWMNSNEGKHLELSHMLSLSNGTNLRIENDSQFKVWQPFNALPSAIKNYEKPENSWSIYVSRALHRCTLVASNEEYTIEVCNE